MATHKNKVLIIGVPTAILVFIMLNNTMVYQVDPQQLDTSNVELTTYSESDSQTLKNVYAVTDPTFQMNNQPSVAEIEPSLKQPELKEPFLTKNTLEFSAADTQHQTVELYEAADSQSNIMMQAEYNDLQKSVKNALLLQFESTDDEPVNNPALANIGLMSSDQITAVNQRNIEELEEADMAIDSYIAGPQTVIEIDRDGGYYKYTFELKSTEF